MKPVVLSVRDLVKVYGPEPVGFRAVDGISFDVNKGEIVGLLGPNGAGKTTTIQMLLGLTSPASGDIWYFDRDFFRQREFCLSQINFASAYSHVQGRLTVRQNLTIYAGLYEVADSKKRIDEVLAMLEATEFAETLFWKLSSGQKTRVILAKALLNRPQLILMDEPTASLDPEIADKVTDIIRDLAKREGVAVLYTSHNMEEVAWLCDRVIFLHGGKIIVEDTPLGLTKRGGASTLAFTFDAKKTVVAKYLKEKGYHYIFPRPYGVEVTLTESEVPNVLFGLSERGVWITEIDIQKPTLEDVFLSIAKGNYERT